MSLTPKAQAIMDVLEQDCILAGQYVNADGQTCAIGALAEAAGFDIKRLLGKRTNNRGILESEDKRTLLGQMREAIKEKFGLSLSQMKLIQRHNDMNFSPEHRRGSIRNFLERNME